MGTREKIEKLETEQVFLKSEMQRSDGRASKCAKLGLSFEKEYPEDYEAYISANKRYNEVEEELVKLYEEIADEERARREEEQQEK